MRSLELVFKHSGGVELREPTQDINTIDTVVWASDADADFMDEFGNEIMSGDEDAEKVIEYLEDEGHITEDEAEALEIFDESLDGDDLLDEEDAEE